MRTMRPQIPLCGLALLVGIAGVAGAQTVSRTVAEMAVGHDSLTVSASNIHVVSVVASNQLWHATTIAPDTAVRAWLASADSLLRLPAHPSGADEVQFDMPMLVGDRGALYVERLVSRANGDRVSLRALGDPGRPDVVLSLPRTQALAFLDGVHRALGATESMSRDHTTGALPVAASHTPQLISPVPTPRYPSMLKSANVEGSVVAQFVVDTLGRVDGDSFHVLSSTHDLFTNAARAVLPSLRFAPGEANGRPAAMTVTAVFPFTKNGPNTPSIQQR